MDFSSSAPDKEYDWPLDADGYKVTKPPPMAYLTSFAEPLTIDNHSDGELVAWDDLQLGEKAERVLAELYTPLPRELKSNLTIPVTDFQGAQAFDLSGDGSRLVVLKDTQLVLYNVSAGERIGALEVPGDWQAESPHAVRFCGRTNDFLVASTKTICRISGKTGQTLARVDGLGESITRWAINPGDEMMVLLTESGKVYYGDPALGSKPLGELRETALDVDVSDDGQQLLVSSKRHGPTHYLLEKGFIVDKVVETPPKLPKSELVVGGKTAQGWFDGPRGFFLQKVASSETGELQTISQTAYFLWRPHLVQASVPSTFGTSLLIVGQRIVDERSEWILFDFEPQTLNVSFPIVLANKPHRMLASEDATAVALLDDTGIHVGTRTPWITTKRSFFSLRCDELIYTEPMEQLERVYEAIGRQTRFADGVGPSDLQSRLLSRAAKQWNDFEELGENANADQRKALSKFVLWYEKGTLLAKTVNAFRHHLLAWKWRGSTTNISPDGWEKFQAENEVAAQELELILDENKRPPALAIAALAQIRLEQNGDFGEVDSLAKRSVSLYPDSMILAENILFKFLPQWYGDREDAMSYMLGHAKLYEGEFSNLVYLHLMRQIVEHAQDTGSLNWGGSDTTRLRRGLRLTESLDWPFKETHLRLSASLIGNSEIVDEMLRHYMSDYGVIKEDYGQFVFLNPQRVQIMEAHFSKVVAREAVQSPGR
ncbi:MAG: hypothetical protein AAFX06_03625 [Planctomycetota bacterium]